MAAPITAGGSFGELLRRYRQAAFLSQEELAERAQLSVTAIQALERGRRTTPRTSTLALLASALGLSSQQRSEFIAVVGAARQSTAASLSNAPLPVPLTTLVGRKREQAEVANLLKQPAVRLVSLIGPGGVGKTRLALMVASANGEGYADGAAFVDLAPLRDYSLVSAAVLQALGLREEKGLRPDRQLIQYLRDRHMLLLLDNCEHLRSAASFLAGLLAACSQVTVLATSRAALRIRGEHVYPVAPLTLPGLEDVFDAWTESEAVALFAERAREVQRDFALTPTNASVVVDTCRQLDGLPLAIELAAARMSVLPLNRLHEQLSHRLGLASQGALDLPARQQTLRATLDWSIGLLTPPQEILFDRLGVFVGGCSLEAIQSVCGERQRPELELIDVLEALVDHSLVRQVGLSEDTARFSMLETIREYAAERLATSGEAAALQQLHAGYYVTLAEAAEPQLQGAEQPRWLDNLEVERANLRAAFDARAGIPSDVDQARLVAALWRFWVSHGHLSEGRRMAERALAALDKVPDDPRSRIRTLNAAGVLAREQGDYAAAEAYFQSSLSESRAARDLSSVAFALNGMGVLRWAQGAYAESEILYEESLALRRNLGDTVNAAMCLNNLGTLASDRGDYDRAQAQHEESLELRRHLRDQRGIAQSLQNLGEVAIRRGDMRRAGELYRESLVLFRELGERMWVTRNLDALARVAEATGDPEKAVRLLAGAAALRQSTTAQLQLTDQPWYGRTVDNLRVELGEAAFLETWAEGSKHTLTTAIDEALSVRTQSPALPPNRAPQTGDDLLKFADPRSDAVKG
jgi:predicted ATPase/transcriptional regulator with XRE-family HTH domain/Tfp pilus assembly protein PilF